MTTPMSGWHSPFFYSTFFLSRSKPARIYSTVNSFRVTPRLMAWILRSSRSLRGTLTGICTISLTNFLTLDLSFSKLFTSTFYASTYISLLLYKFIVINITNYIYNFI